MATLPPQTDEERLAQALAWAMSQLNRRERTVAELRAHLQRKGASEPAVDGALAELVDSRFVDDERFAAMYIADKRGLEQWGSERIRRGLRERGVDRDLAERALAQADADAQAGDAFNGDGPRTDLERALELLRRRFPEPPRERRERDRALGVLVRKGYGSELALDAIAAHARDS